MRGSSSNWYDTINPRVTLELPVVDISNAKARANRRAIKNAFISFVRVRNARDGREVTFPAASVGKMWFNSGVDIRMIAEVHASVVSNITIYKTEGAELSTPVKTQAEDSAPFVNDKIALFLSRVNEEKPDITVIILIGQEKIHLKRCIEKLAPLNPRQIFLVESQPDDGGVAIAKETAVKLGLRLEAMYHKWPGNQAVQFNWALENLPIDAGWILRLDADEYLLPELIEEIKEKLPRIKDEVAGVVLKRRHVVGWLDDKWVKHGMYPTRILRLFRRGRGKSDGKLMDEHIVVNGEVVEFENDFVDHSLISFADWQTKHRNYAKREAQSYLSGEKSAGAKTAQKAVYYRLPRYLRAVMYFCIRYFLKGGFLDGVAGWRWNFWQGLWYRWLVDVEIGKIQNKIIEGQDV